MDTGASYQLDRLGPLRWHVEVTDGIGACASFSLAYVDFHMRHRVAYGTRGHAERVGRRMARRYRSWLNEVRAVRTRAAAPRDEG